MRTICKHVKMQLFQGKARETSGEFPLLNFWDVP
jgi:hypothetical protein